MKNTFILFVLCTVIIGLPAAFRKPAVSRVIINTPDSSVKSWSVYIEKPKHTASNATYYWCDNNVLHHTDGAYSGKLLHGSYESKYCNGQLKTSGTFKYGLKEGEWKQWYIDGRIKETVNYSAGRVHGTQTLHTLHPEKVTRRKFRHGHEVVKSNTSAPKNDSLHKDCKNKHVKRTDSIHNRKAKQKIQDSVPGSGRADHPPSRKAKRTKKNHAKDSTQKKVPHHQDSTSGKKQKKH